MKTFFTLICLCSLHFLFAQTPAERLPDGGGEYVMEKTPCLPPAEYEAVTARVTADREQLRAAGLLPETNDRSVVAFGWPLRPAQALTFNSYYGISNYVDQNTSTGSIQDYNCGARTYDGHAGVDIATWPFPWYLMANDLVEVVAAADGIIISKADGNADDHCSCFGNWNAVYVQHPDGSIAWYGHLKKGSLTPKNIGEPVSQGEYLGVVGSAGCSTGPHLHFEVYKSLPFQHSNLIENFQGSCNLLNAESWWADQQNYRVPTLNAIATHSAPPVLDCPGTNEFPNFSDNLIAGTTGYFGTYYRDQIKDQVTTFVIRRPNNTVWHSWSHTAPDTYSFAWWYFYWALPANGPFGVWKYEVTYQGQTYTHPFNLVALVATEEISGDGSPFKVFPNPATGRVEVSGPLEQVEKLRVFNTLGKPVQVLSGSPASASVDLSGQPAGLYVLEITYGRYVTRLKVLKE